ncbi:MAG TPA: M57 family metalloprotease [Thermoanaerobaculia bacterium]|jgi:hypothetical protein|nr:M57 family metalloprotease [Thermoanaerobaculia bacterium]
MRILVRFLIVSLLAAATSLQAVTYIVPTDRDLVKRAEAIVIATAVESHSQFTSDRRIVTIAKLAIDDAIKGEPLPGSSIELAEPGGVVGERVTFIPGSPRYEPGHRYLVFLRRTADGWATYGFGLGQFEYVHSSELFLLQRGSTEGISGWDEASNEGHVERRRDATGFETFVRMTAGNAAAPANSAYFIDEERVGPFSYLPKPAVSVPGSLDGVSAIGAATGNWTGAGAGVHYAVGASNPGATGGLSHSDGISAVLFNDPANIVPNGVAAEGGISNTDVHGMTTEVDVVVGKNFSTNQATFNGLMTHEIGHTLGFRHSDQNNSFNGPCVAPSPCTSNAIMNSSIPFNLQTLQQWDLDAVRTVYGGQTGPFTASDYLVFSRWQSASATFDYCFGALISSQPTNKSVAPGNQATLNVTATGTAATFQWYIGNPPDTTIPAPNGTTSSLTVSPSSTTTYWVRINACGGHTDSNSATVTVAACVPPSAPAPSASPSSIAPGQSSTVSVNPSGNGPFTYQWFVGTSGDTSNQITGATISSTIVSPTVSTNYWVKVTGQCGSPANSPATLVTVTCSPISGSVTAQPSTINIGQSSVLSVNTNGSGPFAFQWYRGSLGDTSNLIATTASTLVSPVTSTAYWVRVSAPCGSQDDTVTVFVNAPCTPSSITTPPGNTTIAPGGSATLTVVAAGTAPITFQWYTGTSGNTNSKILNATNASLTVSPAVTTTYWVQVANSCNTVGNNSVTAVVTVSAICPSPTITRQPAAVSAPIGSTDKLSVGAGGTTSTVHYQWYQGAKGDVSKKVGTDSAVFVTPTVSVTLSYWVRLSVDCGSFTDSNAAIVTAIAPPRGRAVRH